MKTLLITLALAAVSAVPAFATQRVVRQRVVVRQPVVRQRVVVQRQVFVPHVQQALVPVHGVQQFNAGCHNGALQFNAGGCQQFFAH